MLSWYALHTKPNSERLVCGILLARGIEPYLPLWQPSLAGRAKRPRPFLPCYLFAQTDLEVTGLSTLQYLPGVRRLIFAGDQPARVDPGVIERIRVRLGELEKAVTDVNGEPLMRGDRVAITAGPFQGFDAIFDKRLASGERVRLLIDFLQKRTPLEIPREFVEKKLSGGYIIHSTRSLK